MNTNLAYQEDSRKEIINGEIVAMSPRPAWNHVSTAGNIYRIFANYLGKKRCTPIPDGLDLFLSEENRFVPDFMVVCDREKVKRDGVHGAPDLVVEVLSPSTAMNDRKYKKDIYAQYGVREYWIADPAGKSIEQYLLRDGGFTLHAVYTVYPDWMLKKMTAEECAAVVTHFRCSLYDDLDIFLDDIFDGLLPE